jgi:Family of unknown function (DUF5819)
MRYQQPTTPIRGASSILPATTAAIALASLLFIWHVMAIILYNLPANPLTNQTRGIINPYIGTFFSQAWNFFAPEPVQDNTSVYFRYRAIGEPGSPTTSAWIDMTRALRNSVNYNPLSPLVIINTSVTTAMNLLGNDDFLATRKPSQNGRAVLFSNRESYDLMTLERTAMMLAQPQLTANRPYQIQLMIRKWMFPRFTHRAEPDNPSSAPSILITYPWKLGSSVAGFQ